MKILFSGIYIPLFFGFIALVLTGCVGSNGGEGEQIYFLTGSYSPASEPGVQLLAYNPASDEIVRISQSPAGINPSFLAWSGDKGLVYAINEIAEKDSVPGGAVTSLKLNKKAGSLNLVKETRISGSGPCHVSIAGDTKSLFISNYGDGSLSAVKLDREGLPSDEYLSLSFGDSGTVSHVHMAIPIMGNKKLLVSDLGLDRLTEFDLEEEEGEYFIYESRIINFLPGSGPRHFVYDSVGSLLYMANELSSEVEVFIRDQGAYRRIAKTRTLPAVFDAENYCSHIAMSPGRKYLYVGNRGHNSIAVFSLNESGEPDFKTAVDCEGDWPRHFAISPDGKIMIIANQRSGNITVFKIDPESGIPSYSGISYDIETPSCILFID